MDLRLDLNFTVHPCPPTSLFIHGFLIENSNKNSPLNRKNDENYANASISLPFSNDAFLSNGIVHPWDISSCSVAVIMGIAKGLGPFAGVWGKAPRKKKGSREIFPC